MLANYIETPLTQILGNLGRLEMPRVAVFVWPLLAIQVEVGYPTALSALILRLYDATSRRNSFKFQGSYGTYVMESILFKISFPADKKTA